MGMTSLKMIKLIESEIKDRHHQIADIRAKCQHEWKPSTPSSPGSSFPVCAGCGESKFGWWCETSPTRECDYSLPSGRGYNPDSCRYCGDPEERK